MSKKSFTGGIESLLSPQSEKPQKRGRPKTQTKKVEKSSEEGTKAGETRATFIVTKDLLEQVKALSFWERKQIKDTIGEALEAYVKSKKGKLGAAIKEYREKGR